MAKYTKKAITVDAIKWTGDNAREVVSFLAEQNLLNGASASPCLRQQEDKTVELYHIATGPIPQDCWIVVERTNRIATTVYSDEMFSELFTFTLDNDA